MLFSSRRYRVQQLPQTIFGLDAGEICAMRAQLAERGSSYEATPWPMTVIPSLGIGGGSGGTAERK